MLLLRNKDRDTRTETVVKEVLTDQLTSQENIKLYRLPQSLSLFLQP